MRFTTLGSPYICRFLVGVSGSVTSLPLLSMIPSFFDHLLSTSASLTIHFSLASTLLHSPPIASLHHVLIFPPRYLPTSITPQATGDCKHFLRDGNLSDREKCLEHNCLLFSTVFLFIHLCSLMSCDQPLLRCLPGSPSVHYANTLISIFMLFSFHLHLFPASFTD